MLNVFVRKSAEELSIQLSDGRIMPLEDLVRDYERLLKEEHSKKDEPSKKAITSELKVGEWFRINREIIRKSKEEIHRKCNEAGTEGRKLWERFEKSNKIADENPTQYPILIETYIFDQKWCYKTVQEMRNMCQEQGDGMCDEIICDLELQMRIANGESMDDLVKKADQLPCVRVIKLRNGGTGYFGGCSDDISNHPPTNLFRCDFYPDDMEYNSTPYAFRRVLS